MCRTLQRDRIIQIIGYLVGVITPLYKYSFRNTWWYRSPGKCREYTIYTPTSFIVLLEGSIFYVHFFLWDGMNWSCLTLARLMLVKEISKMQRPLCLKGYASLIEKFHEAFFWIEYSDFGKFCSERTSKGRHRSRISNYFSVMYMRSESWWIQRYFWNGIRNFP